jgi:anti-sigma factor RsiW
MTAPDETPSSGHSQAASLIWYVTGALSVSERRDIERHLESCAECRSELQSLIALHGDMRNAYDAEAGPSARARLTVLERIKSASATDVGRTGALPRGRTPPLPESLPRNAGLFGRLVEWLRAPLVPRWAPVAALMLIVIQAAVLVRVIPERVNTGGEVTTRGLAPAPTRLRAVFNSQATESQIRELLSSLGARIVDGPASGGAYVIELAPGDPKYLGEKIHAARARSDILQSIDVAPP